MPSMRRTTTTAGAVKQMNLGAKSAPAEDDFDAQVAKLTAVLNALEKFGPVFFCDVNDGDALSSFLGVTRDEQTGHIYINTDSYEAVKRLRGR